jgi:ATP-dependent helicase/nuclease subunit B
LILEDKSNITRIYWKKVMECCEGGFGVKRHHVLFSSINEISSEETLTKWYTYQSSNGQKILYVLPSAKWLTSARGKQPGLSFMTFDDLADFVLKEYSIEFSNLPSFHRHLFFQDYLLKNPSVKDMRELPFQSKAYADTYGQLKRLGLSIDELPNSLKTLAAAYHSYEENLIQNHHFDSENKLITAIELLEKNKLTTPFSVVIEGYIDFSPLQYELIHALVSQDVPVTIYIPRVRSAIVETTTTNLEKIGFVIDEYGSIPKIKVEHKTILQAMSISDEIQKTLELIYDCKQMLGNYESIGIVLANEEYVEELTIWADEKGIPVKKAKKKPLNQSMIIHTLKQLIVEKKTLTKWDKVEVISSISQLIFTGSKQYTKWKELYLEKTIMGPEVVQQMYNQFNQYKETLFFEKNVMEHCQNMISFLKGLPLQSIWQDQLEQGQNHQRSLQISFEWRTYEKVLSFLEQCIVHLTDLPVVNMKGSQFLFWLFNCLEGEELFLERAPIDGVGIYTFRDVALFKGSHLYVLGLNEGIYPPAYKLSGYFQALHLEEVKIRFGAPTRDVFDKKAEALFNQLDSLAETINYSYVIGLDQHEPLLPSKYIASLLKKVEISHTSFHERMSTTNYQYEQELLRKTAYHLGKDYYVENTPEQIVEQLTLLNTLASGHNSLSEPLRNVKRSVTAIESFVDCSFKFAMDYVLKVKPVNERVKFVDGRKTGNLLHDVIEKFYKEVNFIGLSFLECADQLSEDKDRVLIEIFERSWTVLEKELLVDISPVLVEEEKRAWLKRMKKWWAAEKLLFQNEQLQNMQIYMIEKGLTFTLQNGLEINIKADRVDIDEEGFVIYDYKSSTKLIKEKEVMDGKVLQLPLYLYALEEILTEKVGKPLRPYGASYINVNSPKTRASNSMWEENGETIKKFNVNPRAMMMNLEKGAHLEKFGLHTKLDELVTASKQHFRVKPYGTKSCLYCTYHSVCRVTPNTFEEE